MGRKCRPPHVFPIGGGVGQCPDPDGDRRELDGRLPGEVLPHPPRRIPSAEQLLGPASGGTPALGGGLPPVPARRHARRADFSGGGLRGEEPLFRIGVFPVALHERGLLLARHHGGGRPHGLLGAAAGSSDGCGERTGAGFGQPQGRRQHRGQHRRHGHAPERRRRRRGDRRAFQQRQLFLDGQRQDRLHAADGDQRRVRIPPEIHHRPPHRLADAAQGLRYGVSRSRGRVPVRAGQPVQGPPRGRCAEFHLPRAGFRSPRRGAVPPDLHPQRRARHGVDRLCGPFGAGHHPGLGDRRRSRAAGPQRFAVGRLPRRLGALQRLRRRDGADDGRGAAPHGRRERFARIAQVFQSDLLRGGRSPGWR